MGVALLYCWWWRLGLRSLYVMEGERAARDEGGPAESHVPEGMSKNQWKKILKKNRYEEGRPEWR